jgi:hypothetical protein
MDNGTLFVVMIFGAIVSARLAANKNRNVVGWLFLGAGFPVISLIALLCLPALPGPAAPPAPACPHCAGPLATT